MKITQKYAIATIAALIFCPAAAFAAEGGESGGSWSALIFYIINFAIFIYLIRRFGGPQISGYFKNRARTIRDNLGRAETARHDAEQLARRAAESLAALEQEKSRMSEALATETRYQLNQIEELTREAVVRLKRDRELTVAAAREAGQRHLREALAAAAGNLARELIRRNFRPGDQSHLLDQFVGRLEQEHRP